MGRSIPTTAQLIEMLIRDMKPLRGAVGRSDQLILDSFYQEIVQHQPAIGNAASPAPLGLMLLMVHLEEHKKYKLALAQVRAEIERVRGEIEAAEKPQTDPTPSAFAPHSARSARGPLCPAGTFGGAQAACCATPLCTKMDGEDFEARFPPSNLKKCKLCKPDR